MEAIGLTASIISIVETSWKLVRYLQGLKQGEKSRRLLLEEVTILWLIFRDLREEINLSNGNLGGEGWVEPLKILGGSRGIATQVHELLSELEAQITPPEGRFDEALHTLLWPFQEKEAMRVVARLQELKQTTLLVIQQSNHRMNREIQESIHHVRTAVDNTFFEKLLAWLTPLNFVRKQRDILKTADPYSCSILGSKSFLSWHENDLRILWFHGAPGAGKSVVAASVYGELKKQHLADNVAVLIAFCSFDDEESQSPCNIIASLLKQILQSRGDGKIPSKLHEQYSTSSTRQDSQPPALACLIDILQEELKIYNAVYVMLDGLDEVGDLSQRAVIVKAIRQLGEAIKLIITSRHSEDITQTLQSTQVCQECGDCEAQVFWRCRGSQSLASVACEKCYTSAVSKGGNMQHTVRELRWQGLWYRPREIDIRDYVTRRMDMDREMKRLLGPNSGRQALREFAIETVVKMSEQLFLLARLHMDSLADCITPGELKRALEGLTGDLNSVYYKSLDRMERALRPQRRQILKKVLLWVAWAQRPLSIVELGHALAVHPSIQDIDEDDIFPVREITTWSAGLLFIDSKDFVRVIHPTASRFFLEQRSTLYPKGDDIIAHVCLHYLEMEVIRDRLSGPNQRSLFELRRKAYPLIDYATLYSLRHVARSKETDSQYRVLEFLLSDNRKAFVQALYYLDRSWTIDSDTTALHISVYLGLTDVVSLLIEQGQAIDARDKFGITPLILAASRGDRGLAEVERLLKAGADPSLICHAGSTALIRAVTIEAEAVISRLLQESSININAVPIHTARFGAPAIILAATSNRYSILEMLLRRQDIDVNSTEHHAEKGFGLTVLHRAVIYRNTRAIQCLLGHKNINIDCVATAERWTPLYFAVIDGGAIDCMEILLDHGADLHILDERKGNLLMRAADTDSVKAVEWLIKRGVDVKHRDFLGRTVLHSAACNRSWRTLSYLVETVPDVEVNAQGSTGETPLHDCCRKIGSEGVKILVSAGARCDIKDQNNRTALDIARLKNATNILEILQKAEGYSTVGLRITKNLREAIATDSSEALRIRIAESNPDEINLPSEGGGTPLHEACRQGRADVVEMLIKAGANIETYDFFGRSPAFSAVYGYHIECLKVLITHGLSTEATCGPSRDGLRLWEEALTIQNWEMAFLLIENGAHMEDTSVDLQNALHRAAHENNVAVARRLVDAGASISQKSRAGYTALQRAEAQQAEAVLDFFRSLT